MPAERTTKEKKEITRKFLVRAVLAGFVIGLGGTAFLSVGGGVVGALLFAIGLLLVTNRDYALYTGLVCYFDAKKAAGITIALILNVIAIIGTGLMVRVMKPGLVLKASEICEKKMTESGSEIFLLGIMCGVLIFYGTAVYGLWQLNVLWKSLMTTLCVMVFILCGFEHSIANAFYFTVAGRIGEASTWQYLGVNIIGNAIGGIFVYRLDSLK